MLKQKLNLKLSQKLSPRQIQIMKLIELPLLEFEQKIQNEIEENPALEISTEDNTSELENNDDLNAGTENDDLNDSGELDLGDDYNSEHSLENQNAIEKKEIPYAETISFHQSLKNQLSNLILTERQLHIAEFLIGFIEESGYIQADKQDIIDNLLFTENLNVTEDELNIVLKKIQTFDPPGIGATSLRECLLLQLQRKNKSASQTIAVKIIEEYFDLFSKKHFDSLEKKLNISTKTLKESLNEIKKLNPKPGSNTTASKQASSIIPDFILTTDNNSIHVEINNVNIPNLTISEEYNKMLADYNNKNKSDASTFLKQKIENAKWFIDAISQRHQTLYNTINAIVNYQKQYFLTGDKSNLRPMVLKDIAGKTGLNVSTISRVANSKYIDTPYGVKLLKFFFSEGTKTNKGEIISSINIKETLKKIIEEENKQSPYSDEKLVALLKKEGYVIARRTVTKYRENLGYATARMRKQL